MANATGINPAAFAKRRILPIDWGRSALIRRNFFLTWQVEAVVAIAVAAEDQVVVFDVDGEAGSGAEFTA
jgi:hypothetical protein